MSNSNLKSRVMTATKWSTITEIAAKLVSPITNMILARILIPEAFGIVTTITMIVSFADMFTDSGFQKYLVQHNFKNTIEKYKYANVAFWTNFLLSLLLWGIIFLFRDSIAALVGNPELGNVLAIACLQLPLTAFSSIQMALYRRDFDFKTLFTVRLVGIFIPFIITIPLALMGIGYWALIFGALFIQISNAVILTIKSKWKPKLYYDIKILSKMLSFSVWSLIEAISIWLTSWIDAFIIASYLSQYDLGIYKTSTTMVNALMSLITAPVIPVLFSTLSRLQDQNNMFENVYYKFQRFISIFVFPIGIGVFLFSELATRILLGNQWGDASSVIGIWALTSSIQIVLGQLCSEVYRSKGRPKLSFLAQMLHLVVLVPACIISAKYGFWALVYTRSLIRMEFVFVHLLLMKYKFGFLINKTLKNIFPTAISALLMGIFGYFFKQINENVVWDFTSIVICTIVYFVILSLFPNTRKEILLFLNKTIFKRDTQKIV